MCTAVLDAAELLLQLPARDRVERAERLVHQQDGRIDGERARDAHALALAAGELVRPAVRIGGRIESDQIEEFAHPRLHAIVRPAFEPGHDTDVAGDRQVGKEADVLDHVPGAAAQPDRVPFPGVAALHAHGTGIRHEQPVDELEDGGLAGAAGADEREDLARGDGQGEVVEDADVARMAERHAIERDDIHRMTILKTPGRRVTLPRVAKSTSTKKPTLLSGGNPQIAKADGAAPVRAYIAAVPGWKRGVGRRLDALVVRTVPGVRQAVKWNSPFYGVEGRGWFLSFHCFTKYVKVTFFNGASLRPPPPGRV